MGAERIETIEGRALPMRGEDIDTDRIMPARFLKSITFEGLEAHLFEDDRLAATRAGQVHPFDEPKYRGASIVVNRNFGRAQSRARRRAAAPGPSRGHWRIVRRDLLRQFVDDLAWRV